jgi:hypothetical protein
MTIPNKSNNEDLPLVLSKPIKLPAAISKNKMYLADLEFIGIDHSGASYEDACISTILEQIIHPRTSTQCCM